MRCARLPTHASTECAVVSGPWVCCQDSATLINAAPPRCDESLRMFDGQDEQAWRCRDHDTRRLQWAALRPRSEFDGSGSLSRHAARPGWRCVAAPTIHTGRRHHDPQRVNVEQSPHAISQTTGLVQNSARWSQTALNIVFQLGHKRELPKPDRASGTSPAVLYAPTRRLVPSSRSFSRCDNVADPATAAGWVTLQVVKQTQALHFDKRLL